jgi:ribosomal protein L37AE/L43A
VDPVNLRLSSASIGPRSDDVKQCPVCKQQTLERHRMGPEQGDGWACTNSKCPDYQVLKNLDLDDD